MCMYMFKIQKVFVESLGSVCPTMLQPPRPPSQKPLVPLGVFCVLPETLLYTCK